MRATALSTLAVIVVSGCGGTAASRVETATTPGSPAAAAASAAALPSPTPPKPTTPSQPLFPIAIGDVWTYREQTEGVDGPDNHLVTVTQTYTVTINAVTTNPDGSLSADATRALVGADNLASIPEQARSHMLTYAIAPDGTVKETWSGSPQFVLLPSASGIESGQPTTVGAGAALGGFAAAGPPVSSVSAHGGGVSSVTVPAGTFSAHLFVVDVSLQVPGPPGLNQPAATEQVETSYWLADDVGVVQIVETRPQCGAPCTTTTQLIRSTLNGTPR